MREELNVEELFASKVFTLGKMKERLPKSTYKEGDSRCSGDGHERLGD